MPSPEDRGLVTVAEAAHWLHLSRDKVYELIHAGEIPSLTLGPQIRRIRRLDLHAWAARNLTVYRAGKVTTGAIRPWLADRPPRFRLPAGRSRPRPHALAG